MFEILLKIYLCGIPFSAIAWLMYVENDGLSWKFEAVPQNAGKKLSLEKFGYFILFLFLWPGWVLVCILIIAVIAVIQYSDPDIGEEH